MRTNAITCTSGPNSVVTVILNDIDFIIKGWKFLRFDKVLDNFSHIFTAHAQKQPFLSLRLQYYFDNTIGFSDPDFL